MVVDIQMPRLSGLELARQLAEVNRATPIIFVSADDDELRARGFDHGAVTVLGKPFSDQALLSAIQSALESSEH